MKRLLSLALVMLIVGITAGFERTGSYTSRGYGGGSGGSASVDDETPPAQPTGLSTTPQINAVRLSWASNTEDDLAGYNIYRALLGGSLVKVGVSTSSEYTDTGLVPQVTYDFAVTARDNWNNESAASSTVTGRPAGLDTLTYVFVMDKTVTTGHYSAEYQADVAAADAVFELGTDLDFAHGFMRENDEDGAYSTTEYRMGVGSEAKPWLSGTATQWVSIIRPSFSDLSEMPADSSLTVLAATMKGVNSASSVFISAADTFSVTLMEGSDQWWQESNLLVNTAAGWDTYASSSWNFQKVRRVASEIDSRFPVGVSSDPWPWSSGDLSGWLWDIGQTHDFYNDPPDSCISGIARWNGCPGSVTWRDGNIMRFQFPNCMQAILNGDTYDGMLLTGQVWTGSGVKNWSLKNWENDKNLSPWFVVKVATESYKSRFGGGAKGAIVFSTDDGRDLANLSYAATLDALPSGGSMTMYIRQDAMGLGTSLTFAEMKTLVESGHEIGTHSRVHDGTASPWGGFNHWFASGPVTVGNWFSGREYPADFDTASATGWENLLWDTDPDWLYDGLQAAGMDRSAIESSQLVAKSAATPLNQYSPSVLRAINFQGYKSLRVGGASNQAVSDVTNRDPDLWLRNNLISTGHRGDSSPWTSVASIAECDTAIMGLSQTDPDKSVNMMMIPLTTSADIIFGPGGAAPGFPSEADIRRNTRRLLQRLEGTGRDALSLYTHDFKVPNPAVYGGGIEADEFEWFATTADSMGWVFLTASEYSAAVQRVPVETPAAWANVPKWTAGDRVFFKPMRTHY